MNATDLLVLKNHTEALNANTTALSANTERLVRLYGLLSDIQPSFGYNQQAMEELKEEIVNLRNALNNQ